LGYGVEFKDIIGNHGGHQVTTEIKVIAGLVAIIVFLGLLFFGFRAVYDEGHSAGVLQVQTEWDADKAAIQKTTDAAIAEQTKLKEDALEANQVIHDNYEKELSAVTATSDAFAKRLRDAENRAHSGPVPKSGGGQSTAPAVSASSTDRLDGLLSAATAECLANEAQLDSLVKEISPQVAP
jgi:hypothetical protein